MIIHPLNLIKALSLSLELSTKGLSNHHWRTAVIANRIAEQINLKPSERENLVYAALLHDIGAAAHWAERSSLKELYLKSHIYSHTQEGYNLLKICPRFDVLASTVLHHHDCWDGSGSAGLKGKEIPLLSRIIHLADRLEVQLRDDTYILEQVDGVFSHLKEMSGVYFDPELVAALEDLSRQESFWYDLTNLNYYKNFFASLVFLNSVQLDQEDVLKVAQVFAAVIDRTSSFTAIHSQRVGRVSSMLAEITGFSEVGVKKMNIAGLFHDLGKLAVPNEILEKAGKLTLREFNIVKQHVYYTYRILQQIDGFDEIAEWAAYHHETLDGQGYPFHISVQNLSLGSRIMAVADVFTALTEERPYRKPLPDETVQKIMSDMVKAGKLDSARVNDLLTNFSFISNKLEEEGLKL